ncbi:MAG: hypothetical protein EPN33_12870 [Acidobacteria bacterium]|nr:MAG: hypothetical protein EPN33_12870 [Acidobacteriota bacterium]
MKNSVLALAVMALAAMVGLAMTPLASAQQTQEPQQQQAQQSQQPVTATGCLQKASNGQGYELTDSSTAKTYALTAASSEVDLSSHVGKTVTVTGTPSSAPAAAATNPAQNQQEQQEQQQPEQQAQQAEQLQVTNIQVVSNSCSGGGLL